MNVFLLQLIIRPVVFWAQTKLLPMMVLMGNKKMYFSTCPKYKFLVPRPRAEANSSSFSDTA